jgi:hypothetical protein
VLNKASLDLRGRRPSPEELKSVLDEPDQLSVLLDEFVRDEGFAERIFSRYGLIYRSRVNSFIPGADGDIEFRDPEAHRSFIRAVGEEPLQIVKHVVAQEQPWTDVMTMRETLVNSDLYRVWPVEPVNEAPESSDEWVLATYTDDRPAAGVLATNGMWWRYTTTNSNRNRARAQAILRILLCDQRFEQPIDFDLDALGAAGSDLQQQVVTEPACVSCHVVIDPIGSMLYGFYRIHPESFSEAIWYYPNRENWYENTELGDPSYFGQDVANLYDLSQQIAADPRFSTCAVEQAFEILYGRVPEARDHDVLMQHRTAFIEGGLTLQALYRSMVDDPLYRLDPVLDEEAPIRHVDPDMMASQVRAITGFEWEYLGAEMLNDDIYGVRTIMGGADGLVVTEEPLVHTIGAALVQKRLAEAASDHLLTNGTLPFDPDIRPTDDELNARIEHELIPVILGRSAEPDELCTLSDLFREVETSSDTRSAWHVLYTLLMRHPDFMEI